MKQLHRKIEHKKASIHDRKKNIHEDLDIIKNKVGQKQGLSLGMLGGLVVGFLLFPRKKKLLKVLLKSFTAATTIRQLVSHLPHRK